MFGARAPTAARRGRCRERSCTGESLAVAVLGSLDRKAGPRGFPYGAASNRQNVRAARTEEHRGTRGDRVGDDCRAMASRPGQPDGCLDAVRHGHLQPALARWHAVPDVERVCLTGGAAGSRTSSRRMLLLATLVLAAVVGCGGPVPLGTRPTGLAQAQSLAGAVGEGAGCGGAELVTAATDHWDFSCTRDADAFLVQAASTEATRDALAAKLRSAGTPVKTGPFYVVSPLPACPVKDLSSCVTPPASSLAPFPGR